MVWKLATTTAPARSRSPGTNTIDGTGLGGVSSTGANISLSGLTIGGTSAVGGAGVAIDDNGQSIGRRSE